MICHHPTVPSRYFLAWDKQNFVPIILLEEFNSSKLAEEVLYAQRLYWCSFFHLTVSALSILCF